MAIITELHEGKLIITVDISEEAITAAPLSTTGKSKVVATTGGFARIPGHNTVRFNLNVIHIDRL